MTRIFLLSPAHSGGKRAAMLMRPNAKFELARQVQIGAASLGEIFTFCSGLYFRGKLAYARRFANPPPGVPGALVITPSRGLIAADELVGPLELSEFATVPVDLNEPRFTGPLQAAARALAGKEIAEVVLLGSIATGKYVEPLLPIFGERLRFPLEFAGIGDMSRGALMLRSVKAETELAYGPVAPVRRSASRSPGKRPGKS